MYGLNALDQRIFQILQEENIQDKFFIEAGANDGLSQSNTAMLEFHHGWNGICVEPSRMNYERCLNNRPHSIVVHAALVGVDHIGTTIKGTFNDNSITRANGLMSACDDGNMDTFPQFVCEVPARTLTSILDEYAKSSPIGFLSLDVENYELQALSGLDFSLYRPKIILMEIGRWNIDGVIEEHMAFMQDKGYRYTVSLTDHDFVFIDKP
jgi:FkbM family methyltransferase